MLSTQSFDSFNSSINDFILFHESPSNTNKQDGFDASTWRKRVTSQISEDDEEGAQRS